MNTDYISVEADQLKRHTRIFTKWINLQLAKVSPSTEVTDFVDELRDGLVLISLIEVLLGISVTRAEPSSKQINQIRNVQEVMRILVQHNIKTTGIIASEITAGDERAILSLIWNIIQHVQINEALKPDHSDDGVDHKLIAWCQERIKGNSKEIIISDLTSNWTDGLGFNLILYSFNPSLVDIKAISSSDVNSRIAHALSLAVERYDVPSLFEPDDFNTDVPDKNMITLFLSYLYRPSISGERNMTKTEMVHPIPTRKVEYEFKPIASHQQTSLSLNVTSDFQSITTSTHEHKTQSHEVFHAVTSVKDTGQEKVLYIAGFPQSVQIQERRTLVVSPFRKPTPYSSRSSSPSDVHSPPSKEHSKDKEDGDELLKFTPPPLTSETTRYQSTSSTVTNKRVITDEVMSVTYTTKQKVLAFPTAKYINQSMKDDANRATPKEVITSEKKTEEQTGDGKQTHMNKELKGSKDILSTENNDDDIAEKKTELFEEAWEPESANEEDIAKDEEDIGLARDSHFTINGSCHQESGTTCMDYLNQELDAVDQNLLELEQILKDSDKGCMDLNTTKNAMDLYKETLFQLESIEPKLYDVLEEGKAMVTDRRFDKLQEDYFNDRMDATEHKLKSLEENINMEYERLLDLYIILLKQHLERMNDWLVRAESRMALDDVIEPTQEGVEKQVADHEAFQEELSNYSMVNMILEMDLEDPAIDETIRDWVKVLSERWAAVWTWAEERKKKLAKTHLDWNNFREEEKDVLWWLTEKEQTLGAVSEIDITDDQQVKTRLNLMKTLEKEMKSQETKLESLYNTGEQLIKDANYYNSNAKGIRNQIEDFEKCWADIFRFVKERTEMLEDAHSWMGQMGNLMREVRSWLDDTEKVLQLLQEEKDLSNENKIHETIESKCDERDQNQVKVNEIMKLEDALGYSIDDTSLYYMKRVTKPFHKRWNDTSRTLNRCRDGDYPFIEHDGCFVL
ncbi:dystrophin-like [Acropora muricata]|uniref:dystrophin-like n=1 Tax=Acropora muricata TaxID=159855 RepID=UPI0034E52151